MYFAQMAQDFVEATSLLVGGRTINIMDTNAVIIASTEQKRVGDYHQGAAEVIATRQMVIRDFKPYFPRAGQSEQGIAGGSFGAILQKLPIAEALSGSLLGLGVGVLLPFVIAALLKTAMGASTVAMITTSAMMAPMMGALGFTSPIARVLVIMAISAGSMTVSHANDSFFWVVSQFSDMDTKAAYKCQTGMTAVMGLVTIVTVLILSWILV